MDRKIFIRRINMTITTFTFEMYDLVRKQLTVEAKNLKEAEELLDWGSNEVKEVDAQGQEDPRLVACVTAIKDD